MLLSYTVVNFLFLEVVDVDDVAQLKIWLCEHLVCRRLSTTVDTCFNLKTRSIKPEVVSGGALLQCHSQFNGSLRVASVIALRRLISFTEADRKEIWIEI